ncbi:MAG: hypothetical protein M3Z04_25580 [Chloroflexota bacterium]|nr:hypothetical protein [Chloroflexota bacterium]
MRTFWRFGRVGSMVLYFHYSWVLLAAGSMAYVALGVLPPQFPLLAPGWGWGLALGAVLLYSVGVVLTETVRTGIMGSFTPLRPRGVYLLPIGAAAPYPLQKPAISRAILATVAGPLVLAGLGLIAQVLSTNFAPQLPAPVVVVGQLLATTCFLVAALHLLPGIPLAGGWLVALLLAWFTGTLENGVTLARRLGLLAELGLILFAVSLILRDAGWVPVLAALAVAGIIHDGGALITRRVQTRRLLETLTAADLMQPPTRSVAPDATLAQVLWGQSSVAVDGILSVADPDGTFLGLLPVARVEDTLQGTWANTTVRSAMIPAGALAEVAPTARVPQVLAALTRQWATIRPDDPAAVLDVAYVPVVAQGQLCGIIDQARLQEYEDLGARTGVQEAAALDGVMQPPRSRRAWAGTLILLAGGLGAVALISSQAAGVARRADATPTPLPGTVTFADAYPAAGAVVGRSTIPVGLVVHSPAAIEAVQIRVNGDDLPVVLDPPAGGTVVTATTQTTAFLLGLYPVEVRVQAAGGLTGRTSWNFRVVPAAGEAPDVPTVAAIVIPTVAPSPTPSPRSTQGLLFPATGYRVAEPFLTFWQTQGGVPIFGYPISDPQPLTDAHGPYTAQYFERARLEEHTPGQVTLGSLGQDLHPPDPPVAAQADARYFAATGHNLSGGFREYWENHGGTAIFGDPISEEMAAVIAGQTYTVQWFTRARLEYHPEHLGTPWSITLSALGRQALAPPSGSP